MFKTHVMLLLLVTFTTSCSSNPSLKNAMGNCETGISTEFSAGDTIRFKYSAERQEEVSSLAENWCSDRGKVSKKSSLNCSGCCSATYRCFKP